MIHAHGGVFGQCKYSDTVTTFMYKVIENLMPV